MKSLASMIDKHLKCRKCRPEMMTFSVLCCNRVTMEIYLNKKEINFLVI